MHICYIAEFNFPLKSHDFFQWYRKAIRIVSAVVAFVTFTVISLQRKTFNIREF